MACKNHPDLEAVGQCATCGADLCAECAETGSDHQTYCAEDLPTQAPAAAPVPAAPAPVPAATAPPPVAAPPPAVAPPPAAAATQSSSMVLAALGYPIWICALIAVLTEKNDREVKFHAWNGLFWGIGYTVVIVVLGVLGATMHDVPGLGKLLGLLRGLVPLAFLIFSIIFAVNAYNRKPVNIPVISDLARKQAGV